MADILRLPAGVIALADRAYMDAPPGHEITSALALGIAGKLRQMLDEDAWPCRCARCIRDRITELDPDGLTEVTQPER